MNRMNRNKFWVDTKALYYRCNYQTTVNVLPQVASIAASVYGRRTTAHCCIRFTSTLTKCGVCVGQQTIVCWWVWAMMAMLAGMMWAMNKYFQRIRLLYVIFYLFVYSIHLISPTIMKRPGNGPAQGVKTYHTFKIIKIIFILRNE